MSDPSEEIEAVVPEPENFTVAQDGEYDIDDDPVDDDERDIDDEHRELVPDAERRVVLDDDVPDAESDGTSASLSTEDMPPPDA